MAIVKMNRFTLLTFEQHKQPLLKALQSFEQVHFRKLSGEEFEGYETIKRNVEATAAHENALALTNYAADRLQPFAALPSGLAALTARPREMTFEELDSFTNTYDYRTVCSAVQDCDERIKALQSELTRLKTENDNLRQWSGMDVAPADLDRLKSVRHAIGAVNKNAAQEFVAHVETAFPTAYVETLHTVKDDTVLLIMASADQWEDFSADAKNNGFTRMSLNFAVIPADKVKENEGRIAQLTADMEKVENELKDCAPHYTDLRIAADYFRTAQERAKACENFMNLADVLIIEGWVVAESSPQFKKLLEKTVGGEYYLEEEAVEKDSEDVPIALKNNKLVGAFEDVTSMFSLPRYNEIDPTPLLMPFYWFFFGIMVGDAAYGLLLVIGTAAALKFLHFKESMRKFLLFFHFLGYSAIFAGCLFSSFLGFAIPWWGPIMEDTTMLLVASVGIGLIQIVFALGVKAYMRVRDGDPLGAVLDAGMWIVALVSGVCMIVSTMGMLPAAVAAVIPYVFFGTLIILALTSGRGNKTIVGKLAGGLFDVYGLTGYVGDLVSYTRLVALSLSGAYIAQSFNSMALDVVPPGFARIVFGTLIIILGQSINLGLSLLGAYVHTCRLQYVEFFGKFYEGGGVPFKPLTPQNAFVQIKKQD